MTSSRVTKRVAGAAAAVAAVLLFSGCSADAPAASAGGQSAPAGGTSTGGAPLPIDKLCGDRPIKVAQVDGFGANSWRKITRAELADELSACKNVTIDYAQADGDLQKYVTAINSYSAQGYDAIITYDDFGSQALGALTNAYKAGVAVVPYIADPGGKVGTDYSGYVQYDFKTEGDTMAKWLAKQVPSGGNVIFTGGLPSGSPSTVALQTSIVDTNAQQGNPFKLATKDPIASSWDPAYMQQAMAGVLAKFPKIDGWASDYGVADLGGLRAMVNANRPIPALATSATDNELGCFWLENHQKNPNFQLLTMDGTTQTVRIAARKAMAAVNKLPDNEPALFKLQTFVDTANGKLPTCHKDLPPDADLSSGLSPEKLKAVFK